jgi:two-component system NtrC family sensor kinase
MSDPHSSLQSPSAEDVITGLAEEVQRLKRELEHAQRLATLGILAAGIAHEINNILTPVLAYAQLATSNPTDEQLHAKALERAIFGVQSATQITQAMLGFASASEQTEITNVQDILRSALDCIARDPAKDRIKMQIDVPPGVEVAIRPLALQQVFINLILNAMTALRSRGGTIIVRSSAGPDGSTCLEVCDTGPGIPSDIAGRLFEPFPHARSVSGQVRSRQKGGTGLGLAICRRIIEEASGTITASSSPNRGTTFTITLPSARRQRAKAG